jgi:hypothetical protein
VARDAGALSPEEAFTLRCEIIGGLRGVLVVDVEPLERFFRFLDKIRYDHQRFYVLANGDCMADTINLGSSHPHQARFLYGAVWLLVVFSWWCLGLTRIQ